MSTESSQTPQMQSNSWRTNYYYQENKQEVGPASVDDLRDLFDENIINLDTLIRREDSNEWKPIKQCHKELVRYLTEDLDAIQTSEISTQDVKSDVPSKPSIDLKSLPTLQDKLKAPGDKPIKLDPNTNTYIYEDQGVIFEYDYKRKAWFPRLDENFFKQQQLAYGPEVKETEQTSNTNKEAEEKLKELMKLTGEKRKNEGETKEEKILRKKRKREEKKKEQQMREQQAIKDGKFQPAYNSSVYVTGLPPNITMEEFVAFFAKCGVIKTDPDTDLPKVKLYRDQNGNLKGDGLVTYFKEPSVDLALQILDGTEIAPGYKVTVSRAEFKVKGEFDPTKQRRKKKKKGKSKEASKLAWGMTEGTRYEGNRVVILKNIFSPDDFAKDPLFGQDLRDEIRQECSKLGTVEKVKIFKEHPEGVVEVKFAIPQIAEQCVQVMNGRWFDGRQIKAEMWDGKTKYRKQKTIEDDLKRWEEFGKSLGGDDDDSKSEKSEDEQKVKGESKE